MTPEEVKNYNHTKLMYQSVNIQSKDDKAPQNDQDDHAKYEPHLQLLPMYMKELLATRLENMRESKTFLTKDVFKVDEEIKAQEKEQELDSKKRPEQNITAINIIACITEPVDHSRPEILKPPALYVEVFRMSQRIRIKTLHKVSCDYWGLSHQDYTLYNIDEQQEPHSLQDKMNDRLYDWLIDEQRILFDKWERSSVRERKNFTSMTPEGDYIAQLYLGRVVQDNYNLAEESEALQQ